MADGKASGFVGNAPARRPDLALAETALVFTFNSATLPPPWKSLKPKNGSSNPGYAFSSRSWSAILLAPASASLTPSTARRVMVSSRSL